MVIDLIIIMLALAGLAYGLRFGLVGALAHIVSIPVGLALVIRVSPYTSDWFAQWMPHLPAVILGWLATSILAGVAAALGIRLANTMLQRAGLQTANRLIGGWMGLVCVITTLSIGQLALSHIAPTRWNALTDRHTSMRCLRAVSQEIEGRIPQNVIDIFPGE